MIRNALNADKDILGASPEGPGLQTDPQYKWQLIDTVTGHAIDVTGLV